MVIFVQTDVVVELAQIKRRGYGCSYADSALMFLALMNFQEQLIVEDKVRAKMDEIFNFPFFKNVGQSLPSSVTGVKNWPAAARSCSFLKWRNCQLMTRNVLQRSTEKKNWQRSDAWNALVQRNREPICAFVDDVCLKVPVTGKLLEEVKNSMSWDIMFMCLETEYADLVEPMFSIPFLEPWYAAGHFPCGWDGDEFTDDWDGKVEGGQLIVF